MKSLLEWAAALLLAAVFGYAGASKLADPADFQSAIDRYQLVPLWASAAAALYLPWLELALAAALLVPANRGAWRGAASGIILGLMLLFAGAYISTLARGLNIECGCFGKALSGWPAWAILLRDAVLLAASGGLFAACLRRKPV